jgi:nucleoside-diphosphate-sugar epimerase
MITVTGGTGMLGAHILYKLSQKHSQVTALKRFGSDTSFTKKIFAYYDKANSDAYKKIIWKDCDITDATCLRDHINADDTIIHAAAMVSFRKKDKALIRETNIQGTQNIVNIALEKGIKKLCHISSVAALSKKSSEEETDESPGELNKTASEYSKSKYYSEMEVWRGISEGLNAVIVNPSVIIGPGSPDKGSGPLFKTAYNNTKFYTEGITGFVDVNDTAEIIIRLIESDISGERFVLNAENISYKQLFETLAKHLNAKAPGIKAGKNLLKTVSALSGAVSFLSGTENKLSKEVVKAALSQSFYSNEKVRKTFGFNFRPVEESVKNYAPFFLNEFRK